MNESLFHSTRVNNNNFTTLLFHPQTSFFHSPSEEPDSLEEFDFETAPMSHQDEEEPIPRSSGLTHASSTAPILSKQHKKSIHEEYSLNSIKDNSQETLKTLTDTNDLQYQLHTQQSNSQGRNYSSRQVHDYVLRDRPFRNYQLFPGSTTFLFGGRIVTGKDFRAFVIGLFIFWTPIVLFAIFTCPFLWNHLTPAVPLVFAYLSILGFANLIKTSWTDPGIIPRNLDPVIEEIVQDENASVMSETPPKEILIKDTQYSLRYCETCKIYRPPRTSHCRQCDNCVEFEDHHCAWLNNCIGKRNYRSFFTFIFVGVLLCLYIIGFTTYQLVTIAKQSTPMNSFDYVFLQAPVSFVLAIYCTILLWLIGGLTMFHCSLIWRGVTTHEQIRADIMKAKYPDLHVNPYNKLDPFKNMAQVLCQPQPKSYLHRRKMADPVIEKL